MIEVYVKDNENYESNGDMVLTPTLCEMELTLEGVAEITLEHPVDELGRWEYLVNDNVIAAPTPYSEKQLFRIYDYVKTENGVTAYARHIFYDSAGEVLLDVRPTKKTGQEALEIILSGTKYKAKSDIKRQSTAYYVRKNIMEVIAGDDENSFLNRWGGERMYDNFTIIVNDRLGGDYGASAEIGRNVTGIEADANIDDVVTRIIPVAYNGYMLDGEKPWVDSPIIGSYANVRAAVIKFEDVKLLEDCQEGEEGFSTLGLLREELKRRCKKEFENGRDKPAVNYKVDLVEISDTDAYKDYSRLTTIGIGDDVLVKDKVLNINVTARCIRLLYDCIERTNLEVEIGNFTENYFDKTTSAADLIQKVTREDGTLKAESVYGKIDGVKAQLRAQRDISQPSPVRATIFEDLVEDSPTYGAMSIGTMGFCIASERTADGKDWDWKTFGTGAGFYADYICAGQLDGALIKADSIQADAISIEYKKSVESHISEAVEEAGRTYENNLEILKSEFSKTYTTFGYVDQTAGSLADEAENNANSYTNEQLKKYATTTEMNTALNQTAEELRAYAKRQTNELRHNYVVNGTFESGTLDGWKVRDSEKIQCIEHEDLGYVASLEKGTDLLYMYQYWNLKAGTYTVRFKAAADTASKAKARIRISLNGTSFYTKTGELSDQEFKQYETEITISTDGTRYFYIYNYVNGTTVYVKDVEVLGKYEDYAEANLTVTNGKIEAEVTRAKNAEETLKASIKVNADGIEKKVEKNDMGSYVTQYYNNVLIAFNKNSNYVQITAGEITIYNGEVSNSGKRSAFNQNGNLFYRDNYFVGTIGTNEWTDNHAHKGLVFDLEHQGKYMAWAQAPTSTSTYITVLCYSRANSIYTDAGLHAGCNMYMHNWNLSNADLRNTAYNGYTGWTGSIPMVTKIEKNSDGSITWYSSAITVRNGGITSAPVA